jgi:hypothetical protein
MYKEKIKMNTAPQITYEQVVDNLQPLTAEQLGLLDGAFLVKRGRDGTQIDKGGWFVSGINSEGLVVIENADKTAVKRISPDKLRAWQGESDTVSIERARFEMALNDIGYKASSQVVEAPEFVESPRDLRLKELFKSPVVAKEETAETYDHLFTKDEAEIAEQNLRFQEQLNSARRPKGREDLRQTNIDVAVENMQLVLRNNPDIRSILAKNAPELHADEEIVNGIRTMDSLRLDLGKYFLDKINRYSDILPERVKENSLKNPNYYGYEGSIRSRVYVALLCLSRLDGTFDYDSADSDPVEENNGKVILGQHRSAAETVLFS